MEVVELADQLPQYLHLLLSSTSTHLRSPFTKKLTPTNSKISGLTITILTNGNLNIRNTLSAHFHFTNVYKKSVKILGEKINKHRFFPKPLRRHRLFFPKVPVDESGFLELRRNPLGCWGGSVASQYIIVSPSPTSLTIFQIANSNSITLSMIFIKLNSLQRVF